MAFNLTRTRRLADAGAALCRLAAAWLLLVLGAPLAHAVTITAATFTSTTPTQTAQSVVYVKGSETLTANITGNTLGSSDNWRGTGWRIATTTGSGLCADTGNNDANNSATNFTVTATLTAPAAAGTYNVYLQGYSSNNCNTAVGTGLTVSGAVVVDNTAPTATIACSSPSSCGTANPTNATSVSWSVTFSEAVTGLTTANFSLSNSGLTSPSITSVTGSGTNYTVTANTGTGSGTLGLNMASSLTTILDRAGNNPATVNAATGNTFTIDKVAPTIGATTIASNYAPAPAFARTGSIVTLTFATSGTAATPVPVVTIAGRSASVSGGPTAWTAAQTMAAGDTEGTVAFTINVSDTAGNAATPVSAVTSGSNVTFDKTLPIATIACSISCGTAAPTKLTSVSWGVTFSEAVTGVTAANFSLAASGVTGASITGITPNSSTSYTVTANTGSGSGTLGLNMASGLTTIIDRAGNNPAAVNAAAGNTYTVDKSAPTIVTAGIASNNTTTPLTMAKVGDTVTVSFTTSGTATTPQPVVTIAGRAATIGTAGPTSWTASIVMASGDAAGTVPFTINVSDLAGNAATQVSATTNSSSVTFDKTAPTVTSVVCTTPSSCGTGNPTSATQVTWTVTFSEAVTGVQASNFTLAGTGSGIAVSGSGTTRTVQATTGANGTTIGPNLSTVTGIVDAAGNVLAAGTSATTANTYTIDKAVPVITAATIASNNAITPPTLAKVGDTVTVSFTTSGTATTPQPVVTIAGRAATIGTAGPTTWTASIVMASGDPTGVVAFTINVSDSAGNAALPVTAITSGSNVTFDKTSPSATITCSNPTLCGPGNVTGNSQVTWAVDFSENVTGLAYTNFGFSGSLSGSATIPAGGVVGSGSNYTVTANVTGLQGDIGLNLTQSLTTIVDAAGNSPGSVIAVDSNKYTIAARPVATISCASPALCGAAYPTNLSTVTWAVTFSQSVTGVTAANFSLSGSGTSGASINSVSGSGTAWTVTATTGANGTLGLDLSANLSAIVGPNNNSPLAVAAVAANTYTKNSAAAGECYTDDFNRASLGANWSTTSSGGSFGQPGIVANRLRLTDASASAATAAHLQRIFPAAGNKIVVEFDYYGYNNTSPGADGIGVALSNGSIAPVAGAFGGSLGYAQKAAAPTSDCATFGGCPGFAGGWLGIGIDEYGNFSKEVEGRVGGDPTLTGITLAPNTVGVRGSGSGLSDYRYHRRSTTLTPTVGVVTGAVGPGHRYRITIDHSDGVHAYVTVERDTTVNQTAYTTIIAQYDAKAEPFQAAVPDNWFLSFMGSTGSTTNIHEIDNLQVCTTQPIAVPTLHHVRVVHDGNGATCAPETVTLRACADASCNALYLGSVSADLTTTDGTWSSDPVIFSGGQTTVTLTKASAGSVTLGGSVTSPAATVTALACYNVSTSGDCVLPFSASSCAFDVVMAGKMAGTPIYTKLAGTSFSLDVLAISAGAINGNFAGTVTPVLVDQNSSRDSNGCGSTVLAAASPASIAMTAAGNSGRASFSFNYAHAAADVRVKVSSGSTTACSNDNFAIRPATFGFDTTASNSAATGAPVVKAGDGFSFYAVPMNSASTPVATNGYFGTASYFSGLLTAGSGTEVLGQFTGTFGAANGSGAGIGGGSGGTFTYSEAGRFRLGDYAVYDATFANVDRNKASPECFMDGNLGTVTALTTLPNTFNADGKVACFFGNAATTFGRFIPDHFDTVITQTATAPMACPTGLACPARFSGTIYSGQPFTMQVIAKRKGAATAANDGVVTNYNNTSTYARDVTLSAWSARGTTDQALPPAAPAGSVLGVTSVPRARFISGVAELDGSGIPLLARQTYTFGRAYSAAAPTAVGNWIAPTTVYIRATETDVGVPNNIVSDGVTTVRNPVADSEEAGILVLSGRMLVPHVTGSELLRLRVPLLAQYWNGTRWVTNYVDNVSTYSSSEVARSSYVKGLNANNTQLVPQSSAALVKGAGQFYMQAAGAGISGSVDFNLTGPTWLPSTIGRSRVGTYRSPLIFIREVY